METGSIIILVILATIIFYLLGVFNNLVSLRNRYLNAFAQIEVHLNGRYELIPNLIESAKGFFNQRDKRERETLEAVIAARNAAATALTAAVTDPGNAVAIKELGSTEGVLGAALNRFNEVMESCPDSGANQNMMQFSENLISTENKVTFSRQGFNDQVMAYNTYKRSFPAVILANTLGHGADAKLLQFENPEDTQEAPEVSF